ncbi:CsbD family protein [Streptomyces sp. NPDC001339]|uniref:CsbD family protein n=1 Tax=Streptomyces sp. NPDC001339 TaxID=3364563 RepID=UPI0036ABCA33
MRFGKKAKGLGETAAEKVKETTGKTLGEAGHEWKGRAEQARERVKQAVERGKRSLKH